MPGGGTANWNAIRRLGSWGCTKLAQWMLGVELRDPMSGYFMMRRDDFMKIRDRLNVRGFKILLEIAAHMQPCHLREVPYTFGPRARGESKLTNKIIFAYLLQLWRLYTGDRHTASDSSSVMVGTVGETGLRDLSSASSEGQKQKGLAAYAAVGSSRK
jgi:dolichol-phosphate mannosyltransferase